MKTKNKEKKRNALSPVPSCPSLPLSLFFSVSLSVCLLHINNNSQSKYLFKPLIVVNVRTSVPSSVRTSV